MVSISLSISTLSLELIEGEKKHYLWPKSMYIGLLELRPEKYIETAVNVCSILSLNYYRISTVLRMNTV